MLLQTSVENFFQTMSVRLNADKAKRVERTLAIEFTDLDKSYLLSVRSSVMHYSEVSSTPIADATLKVTRDLFVRMLIGDVGLRETLTSDELEVEGSIVGLLRFFVLFDSPDGVFNIVTP